MSEKQNNNKREKKGKKKYAYYVGKIYIITFEIQQNKKIGEKIKKSFFLY